MTTDSERREVASNIMENYVCGGLGYKVASAYNIAMAIGMTPGVLVGDIELWERLADLIKPSTQCPHYHSDRHYCSIHEDVRAIDREALLALADELDAGAKLAITHEWSNQTFAIMGHMLSEEYATNARRIREACGATS